MLSVDGKWHDCPPGLTRDELLERLRDLTNDLASRRLELFLLLRQEHAGKLTTFLGLDGSLGEREKHSAYTVLEQTNPIFDLKGEIAALEDERTYLITALQE
jgi:hypothetical protein